MECGGLAAALQREHVYQWSRMHVFSLSSLALAVPVAVQFVIFLRWLHRRMRNDEITRAFVRDIATNHLPHIYSALHVIAQAGN